MNLFRLGNRRQRKQYIAQKRKRRRRRKQFTFTKPWESSNNKITKCAYVKGSHHKFSCTRILFASRSFSIGIGKGALDTHFHVDLTINLLCICFFKREQFRIPKNCWVRKIVFCLLLSVGPKVACSAQKYQLQN